MTVHVYWRLDPAAEPQRSEPSLRPDISYLPANPQRAGVTRFDHYAQVARAAAITGFDGLFVAHRTESDDSQIIAASVARTAPGLLLVPEFPASVGSAVYAAKQAVSFQRATHNRLGWAVIEDADPASRAAGSDPVADDDLLARKEEFLTVARGVHGARPFSHKGRIFEVQGGGFEQPLASVPFPRVFLTGASEEALGLSARIADVHLFEHAPVPALRERIETLDRLALAAGRNVGFGVTASVIARESREDLPRERADIYGTYDEVAAVLAELASAGVEHLVLSGSPSLEEAYRLGQFVLPPLRSRTAALRAAA
jgi:alkanesulfonate monooxygenase